MNQQRRRLIEDMLNNEMPVAQICKVYGISRKTAYKWLKRFREHGDEGLTDRSRAPHSIPHATKADVVELVLAVRRANPTWGPRKIVDFMRAQHADVRVPAASTIAALLKINGLSASRAPRTARARVQAALTAQVDDANVEAVPLEQA